MAGDSPDQEVVVRMILYGVIIVAFVLTVAIMPTVHLGGYTEPMNSHSIEYESAYTQCVELVRRENCAPILVRLAWHDSGNYDINSHTGGATGSIRFDNELAHGGNAGLKVALELLEPIMKEHPRISRADIIQMASAAAIQASGGPKIPMKYGRIDATSPSEVPEEGRLPTAGAPFHQATGPHPMEAASDQSPAAHLRAVFYRMEMPGSDGASSPGRPAAGDAGL
ncbi:putative L-ascorbate peroxidase 7, chloroplastic [Cymbomonas tetramitiformis]|uniref:L-ascorbate peroxidase 7, chloroplastic n=1 Tax=Cymbomonas tetramitiformis TaxID=36881 RepID=A0AAE0FRJ1_9CHLO|nr:putative L-ascorbate peroxidase 7, chloroplastic [Cymbomonas tetramitiformis]